MIRRRRECLGCERRFTSYERIEEVMPLVAKKDGRREPFERQKILHGLKMACGKRPVSTEQLEDAVNAIERKVLALGVKETPSSLVGEEVMSALKDLDMVAYVRFASVYRHFKDIGELMQEVKNLFEGKGKT